MFTAAASYCAPQNDIPKEVPFFNSWMDRQTATGNWNGARNELTDKGLTISSNFTTDLSGNPSGGLKQSYKYAGLLDLALSLDLEKLASFKGLALVFSNYLFSGSNLSAAIGEPFGVQEIYSPGNYYLGQIDLSQSLFDDTVTLEAGRIFAGDVFATSIFWQYYLTGGLNNNFEALTSNIFFPHFQVTSWGSRVSYEPNKNWDLVAAIYNADPSVADTDNYGAYLNFRTKYGYLAIAQLTYKHNQNREDNGLPGSTCFGGYYESSKFTDIVNPNEVYSGNYGLYLIADQMIYKGDWPDFFGPSYARSQATYSEKSKNPYHRRTAVAMDRPNGLSLWGGAYLAPQVHRNAQTFQLATGLAYQGLLPNRNRDVTALAIVMGKFSRKLTGQRMETVLELNHRFQTGPWFYITPDIQYVINPNGQDSIRDAFVLGLEISANF